MDLPLKRDDEVQEDLRQQVPNKLHAFMRLNIVLESTTLQAHWLNYLFLPLEKRVSVLLFLIVWYDKNNNIPNLIHFYAEDFLFLSFSEVKCEIVVPGLLFLQSLCSLSTFAFSIAWQCPTVFPAAVLPLVMHTISLMQYLHGKLVFPSRKTTLLYCNG